MAEGFEEGRYARAARCGGVTSFSVVASARVSARLRRTQMRYGCAFGDEAAITRVAIEAHWHRLIVILPYSVFRSYWITW